MPILKDYYVQQLHRSLCKELGLSHMWWKVKPDFCVEFKVNEILREKVKNLTMTMGLIIILLIVKIYHSIIINSPTKH